MSVQKAVKSSSHYEAESNMEQDVIIRSPLLLVFVSLSYFIYVGYFIATKKSNLINRLLEKHGSLSQVVLISYGEVILGIGSSLEKTGWYTLHLTLDTH